MKFKKLPQVTVYVEYRCQAGEGFDPPADRLLRARVVQYDAEGPVFGAELIAPRKLTDRHIGQLQTICIKALQNQADQIVFQYEPRLRLECEVYPIEAARSA